jgi:hypothetical protein
LIVGGVEWWPVAYFSEVKCMSCDLRMHVLDVGCWRV